MRKTLSTTNSISKKTLLLFVLFTSLTACKSASSPIQITPSATTTIKLTDTPIPTETQSPPMRGERIIQFSGYEWIVRDSGSNLSGPGPNLWDGSNIWIDDSGDLHLKITHAADGWHSAEITMTQQLGFGRYQFQVIGQIDQLDPNVVLGLFNYPTEEIGPDGTNEIDIEFAHWGDPAAPIGNFTVWPAQSGIEQTSDSFSFELNGTYTTQRFIWESRKIFFQSLHGHRDDDENQITSWLYQPDEPSTHISQQAMPIHINLWLFQGQAPANENEIEIIIHSFTFTPLE